MRRPAVSLNLTFKLIVALALIAPWLLPPQGGPSPSVVPWLFSLACAGVLLGVLPLSRKRWLWSCWLAAGCLGAVFVLKGQVTDTLVAVFALGLAGTCAALAASVSTDSRSVFWLATAWLIAGLISAVIGLCQYFGVEQYFLPWMSQSGAGEAFANLRQRNQFATLTNMGLLALLWHAVPASSDSPKPWAWWAVTAAAVLLSVGNAASSSRTGLVQLSLLVILAWLWGWLRQPAGLRVLLVAVLTYGVAALTLPMLAGLDPATSGILARLHDGGPACASRLTLWGNVLHLIGQRPWLGWGWGELDYAHYMTFYGGSRFCEILDNAHNLPLHLAVELGIPVALAVCGGFVWWVLRQRPWGETDPTRQMAWGVLTVILLHSMLEYPLWYGPFQMAFGLSLGLLWRSRRMPATQPEYPFKESPVSIFQALAATVLIAVTAYAGWDYHRISQIY
ncbi:MAG: Wzy polymerase domain-containing protein, partial [Pseudomonas sp.]